MAKNTNRVASAFAYVAALVLATGALADKHPWELDVANPVTYAKELLGGNDVKLTLDVDKDDEPATTVTITPQISAKMTKLAQADVTFTLKGGTFGERVRWADIDVGSSLEKVGNSQSHGRAGDNEVTVTIKAMNSLDVGDKDDATVSLSIASVTSATGHVTVGATVVATDGDVSFPEGDAATVKEVTAVAEVKVGGDIITPAVMGVVGTSDIIATAKLAQTFMGGTSGAVGQIDLADRKSLTTATSPLMVGSFTHTETSPAPLSVDGETEFVKSTTDSPAKVHVKVSGMIRASDIIYLELPGGTAKKADPNEIITVAGRVAEKTFDLDKLPDTASVYFMPGADAADLKRGKLTASFAVDYVSASVTDPKSVEAASATLKYAGIGVEAQAYAIPKPGSPDIGNVRIRCQESGEESECTVFLECTEQDGTSHFGELVPVIPGGATRVVQAGHIADVLDVASWGGRLSCDVMADGDLAVQVLVRSGDSLINNTYIDHTPPSP